MNRGNLKIPVHYYFRAKTGTPLSRLSRLQGDWRPIFQTLWQNKSIFPFKTSSMNFIPIFGEVKSQYCLCVGGGQKINSHNCQNSLSSDLKV